MIVEAGRGRVIINALSTGEIALVVEGNGAAQTLIVTPEDAEVVAVALIEAARKGMRHAA